MGRLSAAAKDRALRAAVGSGTLYLGLATEKRANGQLVEETDTGYARVPVAFGEPVGDPDERRVENATRVDFPPYDRDAGQPLRWWFVTSVPSGAGELVASGRMLPRMIDGDVEHFPQPFAGEAPFFAPGDLSVSIADVEDE